jgi:hypothetical protein
VNDRVLRTDCGSRKRHEAKDDQKLRVPKVGAFSSEGRSMPLIRPVSTLFVLYGFRDATTGEVSERPHFRRRGEPEMVDAEYEHRLTDLARRRERDRQLAAWRPTRKLIAEAVASFQPEADRRSLSDLRVISRTLRRIDERLRAQ